MRVIRQERGGIYEVNEQFLRLFLVVGANS